MRTIPGGDMVRIAVCRECGWTDDEVRRAIRKIRAAHAEGVRVVKRGCLDACGREPVVCVGKKLLAPATPKKIRRAVARRLERAR